MSYDALGNPLRYYNGNSYMFTWQKGRMLTKTVNNNVTTTYTYNADGIRIGKNVGGTAVEYVLDGALILAEKHGDDVVRYFYDASGSPVGMIYGSTTYLFEKNSLGDVIGMWTSGGSKVASYVYDAWGNIISESVSSAHQTASDLNPFRYRGYYYDQETGFYYLQSRYYDPTTGRFLNADSSVNANGDLQGFNMYAYCSNNPVMYVDYTGDSAVLVSIIIGVILGGIYGSVSAYANDQSVVAGFIIGAIVGGLTSYITEVASIPYMLLGTFGAGFGGDILSQWILEGKSYKEFNLISAFWAGIANAGLAYIGKAISDIVPAGLFSGLDTIIFGTLTNSPLLALGMAFNMTISNHATVYTIGDLLEDIFGESDKEVAR